MSEENFAEMSLYDDCIHGGRGKFGYADFATIEQAEEYVSGWIQYSEDNTWRYYQREQLRSNHNISTWIRIRKVKT